MLNINCNFCNKINNKPVYKPINSNRSIEIFCCNSCGLLFSKSKSPYVSRPKPSMSCDANRSSIKYTKQLVLNDHMNFLVKKKIDLKKYFNFLDIGSNRGDFIKYLVKLKSSKFLIDAIETDPYVVDSYLNKENINLIIDRFESVNLQKNNYDFIHCVHTLEHFENIYDSLLKMKNSLKNSGLLFLVVPNIEYGALNTFTEIFIDTHTFHFRFKVLENIVKTLGFVVVSKNEENEPEIKLLLKKNNSDKTIMSKKISKLGDSSLNFIDNYSVNIIKERNNIINAVKKIESKFNDKIICWGAGRIFDGLISIGRLNPNKIVYLVDKYLYKYFKDFYGVKLNSLSILKNVNKSIPILVCSFEYFDEIKKQASKLGFNNIYNISKFLTNEKV